jgi:hypothetical protein
MSRKTTLRDLLMGGPGHNAYAYQATLYCVECGKDIIRQLWADGSLPEELAECGDTEVCPVPVFFGESPDCEQHCDHCGEYLYGESPEAETEEAEEEEENDD